MKCGKCQKNNVFHIRIRYIDDERIESCESCGGLRIENIPDVSQVHEPYCDENLWDEKNKRGTMITSRRQKSDELKRRGLREKRESKIKYIADPEKRRKYCLDQFG